RGLSAQRDGDAVDANRDGITSERTFMQNFHAGALDKAKLDQSAFEVVGGQAGRVAIDLDGFDATAEPRALATQAQSGSAAGRLFIVDHGPCRPPKIASFVAIGERPSSQLRLGGIRTFVNWGRSQS